MNFGETNFQSIQLLDINSKFLFCKPPPIPFSFVDLSLAVTYMPGKSCPRLAPSCTARSRAAPAAPWRTGLWSSHSDTCDSHCCGCSRLKSPICFPHNPRSPLCSGFTDRAQGRPPPWYPRNSLGSLTDANSQSQGIFPRVAGAPCRQSGFMYPCK